MSTGRVVIFLQAGKLDGLPIAMLGGRAASSVEP